MSKGPDAGVVAAVTGDGTEAHSPNRARYELDELLGISRAMSSQRDINKLLGLILEKSRQITGADAGSVYVLEPAPDGDGEKRLHFMLSQNDSMKIDFKEFHLRVDGSSIVGRAVLDRKPINTADLGRPEEGDPLTRAVRHNRSFDDKTGYRTRSMLTVPMLSAENEVIGVIQLINKKRTARDQLMLDPADFEAEVDPLRRSLRGAGGRWRGRRGLRSRTPCYTPTSTPVRGFHQGLGAGHRGARSDHGRAFVPRRRLHRAHRRGRGPGRRAGLRDISFTKEQLRELRYASLLHDFGKVGVRENVLVKAKKLYDWQRAAIELRFRYIRKALEAECLKGKLDLVSRGGAAAVAEALSRADGDLAAALARVDEAWQVVSVANEPALLQAPVLTRLREVAQWEYADADGRPRPFLEPQEVEALEVGRGSLTPAERDQIQSHVSHTITFLETIPWGRSLRSVPRIAGAHHESMDGKGYPKGLSGTDIPIESRMLTISDIFDALTASDRPYKAAVPGPKALDIIASEVKAGRCDPLLFQIFVEGEVWKRVL